MDELNNPTQPSTSGAPPETKPAEQPKTVPLQALQEERLKREELASQMAVLEGQIQRLSERPIQDPFDIPAPVRRESPPPEDLENAPVTKAQVRRALAQHKAEIEAIASDTRMFAQEQKIRGRVGDEEFEKATGRFWEEVKRDPSIYREAMSTKDPSASAYKKGKELLNPPESPEQMRAKIEAEVREKMIREYEQNGRILPPSAPSASGNGSAASRISIKDASNLNSDSWEKLTPEQRDAVLRGDVR